MNFSIIYAFLLGFCCYPKEIIAYKFSSQFKQEMDCPKKLQEHCAKEFAC